MAMGESTPSGGGSLVPAAFMGGTGSSRARGGKPPKHKLATGGKAVAAKPGRAGKVPGTKAAVAATGSFGPRGFPGGTGKGRGRTSAKPGRAGKRK